MGSLEITTNVGCVLACKFCPQDKISKLYKAGSERILTVENFKKYLSSVPADVRIDFSGYSEPFLNRNCIDLIQYVVECGYPTVVYSTLTGMSPAAADRLKDYLQTKAIRFLVIHLPDRHNNMPGFKIDEDYLYCLGKLLPLENVSCMTMSRNNEVLVDLVKFVKGSLPRSAANKLPKNKFGRGFMGWRRGGTLDTASLDESLLMPEQRWSTPISCASTPFYNANVLMPNGNVHLCCMDYAGKHVLGNLGRQTYTDLFSSTEYSHVIRTNLENRFSDETLCRRCEDVITHSINYDGHGWTSRRPGHLVHEVMRLGIGSNRSIALTKLVRGVVDVRSGLFDFIRNK